MALKVTFDLQEQRVICDKYTVLNNVAPIPFHVNCKCSPLPLPLLSKKDTRQGWC